MNKEEYTKELEKIKEIAQLGYATLLHYLEIEADKNTLKAVVESQKSIFLNKVELFEHNLSNITEDNNLKKQLGKTKLVALTAYGTLLNYFEINAEKSTLISLIKNQQEISILQIENFEQRLKNIKAKNPLTEEWWSSLPQEWKDIFLFNIELFSKIDNFDKYEIYNYHFDKYENTVGKDYIIREKYSIPEVIESVWKLEILVSEYSFKDLNPIANLINLKKLHLRNNIADLSPIATLINLTELNIGGNESDLSPIANLINLTKLDLKYNCADLSPIANLINLTELDLWSNKSDLSPIANLINLTKLNLWENESDLSPIANLINLTELKLSRNYADSNPIHELIIHIKSKGGRVW